MDKVFIFHLPDVAEKLQGEYEVISGNSFKDAARKASPPLTDKLAFSVIKNQDSYGFPADKWVKLAVEKLGPVLIVGHGSLSGVDGANYLNSEDEIYSTLSAIGIEAEALAPQEDFSGLFTSDGDSEQHPAPEDNFALPGVDTTPGSSAGVAEQYETPDLSPVAGDTAGFALPGIVGAPDSSAGVAEQDQTPTATLPITQAQLSPLPSSGSVPPASSSTADYALPGVSEPPAQAPTADYALPGVSETPAQAPTDDLELPEDYALPESAIPNQMGMLYDDIELNPVTPAIVDATTPGSNAAHTEDVGEVDPAPKWEPEVDEQYEASSTPTSSWEEEPAETSWRSVSGASEPVRPAPAPPIAPAANPHTTIGGCPTIIVFGAKGGVGKTTTSIHLAQRAGKLCPDMRITLIDANRGQGDIRTKLRTLNVPTIFDALPEEGRGAIITPPALDKDRPAHLDSLAFALIAAPPSELSDPSQVTPQVYQNALNEARSVSDLVIVDTQISEKYDTTKLFENFLIPLLIKDEKAWGVGATEDSPESINNLLERLHQYRTRGVKPGKIFTLIAQAHAHNTPEDLRDFESMFDKSSSFAGAVPYNKTIYNRLSSGILCDGIPQVAEPLDRILYAVTGKNAFATKRVTEKEKPKKKKRRFGRGKRR